MSKLAEAFYKQSKVVLVEPLGGQVHLGSVGYLDKSQWVEIGTTESMFGLKLSSGRGSSEPNSFDAKGGSKFKFESKLAGQVSRLVPVAADAKARLEITFGSEGAFVMNVKDQTVKQARELGDLMAAIRYAYRYRSTLMEGQRWEKHYAVIVGIASARSVTALASESSEAAVIVTGSAKLPVPTTPAELDAKMNVSYSTESVNKLWRGPAAGYAFQALQIRPSMFRRWDREDIDYLEPDLSFSTPTAEQLDYAAWAKDEQIKPETFSVQLLGASGSGALTGTAAKILGTRAPKRKRARRAR